MSIAGDVTYQYVSYEYPAGDPASITLMADHRVSFKGGDPHGRWVHTRSTHIDTADGSEKVTDSYAISFHWTGETAKAKLHEFVNIKGTNTYANFGHGPFSAAFIVAAFTGPHAIAWARDIVPPVS